MTAIFEVSKLTGVRSDLYMLPEDGRLQDPLTRERDIPVKRHRAIRYHHRRMDTLDALQRSGTDMS